jgi:hypothetical protein
MASKHRFARLSTYAILTLLAHLTFISCAEALSLGFGSKNTVFQQLQESEPCDVTKVTSCQDLKLTAPLANLILETISQYSNTSPNQITITRSQHIIGGNGCRGNNRLSAMCTTDLVSEGWLVREGSTSRWQYRISSDNSSELMISQEPLSPTVKDIQPIPQTQPVPEPSTLLGSVVALILGNRVYKCSKRKQSKA